MKNSEVDSCRLLATKLKSFEGEGEEVANTVANVIEKLCNEVERLQRLLTSSND